MKIHNVSKYIAVATSAMREAQNAKKILHKIYRKTKKISKNFPDDEKDVILSTGEQISCALIAGKLNDLGYKSRSWLGWQIPIITSGNYSFSRIIKIRKKDITIKM